MKDMDSLPNRSTNEERVPFGYESIPIAEKPGRVEAVFESVASNYDSMNDLMSLGLHRRWKDEFVESMHPRPDQRLLDLAGGTGDIAERWRRRGGGEVCVVDYSLGMLTVGRQRSLDKNWFEDVSWIQGDGARLPLVARRFDTACCAFGMRNMTDIDATISEARRVLKPLGKFHVLEFAPLDTPLVKELYHAWSFLVLPRLGALVARDRSSYRYLAESIRRFDTKTQFQRRLDAAGFVAIRAKSLNFGIAIHYEATRP